MQFSDYLTNHERTSVWTCPCILAAAIQQLQAQSVVGEKKPHHAIYVSFYSKWTGHNCCAPCCRLSAGAAAAALAQPLLGILGPLQRQLCAAATAAGCCPLGASGAALCKRRPQLAATGALGAASLQQRSPTGYTAACVCVPTDCSPPGAAHGDLGGGARGRHRLLC